MLLRKSSQKQEETRTLLLFSLTQKKLKDRPARRRGTIMNHPNLISQICLNCTAGFVVLECANFVEETGTCEGCEVAHCCRQCGSHDTRPKTEEDKKNMFSNDMYVPPVRALYQCGDCGLEFTQRQCASHIGDGTTCMDDCNIKGADKDDTHRCPMCLTLSSRYAGPISK